MAKYMSKLEARYGVAWQKDFSDVWKLVEPELRKMTLQDFRFLSLNFGELVKNRKAERMHPVIEHVVALLNARQQFIEPSRGAILNGLYNKLVDYVFPDLARSK